MSKDSTASEIRNSSLFMDLPSIISIFLYLPIEIKIRYETMA